MSPISSPTWSRRWRADQPSWATGGGPSWAHPLRRSDGAGSRVFGSTGHYEIASGDATADKLDHAVGSGDEVAGVGASRVRNGEKRCTDESDTHGHTGHEREGGRPRTAHWLPLVRSQPALLQHFQATFAVAPHGAGFVAREWQPAVGRRPPLTSGYA